MEMQWKSTGKKTKDSKGSNAVKSSSMSEGPAGELRLSAAQAAKRTRRDGGRICLLRWLNRRLDVVNVPLGMKVRDLADRLAAPGRSRADLAVPTGSPPLPKAVLE